MEQTRSAELGRDVLTSIYLDYGADAQECKFSDLKISERGMVFKAHWQFPLGTQLELVFSYWDSFGQSAKATIEAIVVDCEEAQPDGFAHLLIFPEITSELKAAILKLQHGRHPRRAMSLN